MWVHTTEDIAAADQRRHTTMHPNIQASVNLATETAMVRVVAPGSGHSASLDAAEAGLGSISTLAGQLAQVCGGAAMSCNRSLSLI